MVQIVTYNSKVLGYNWNILGIVLVFIRSNRNISMHSNKKHCQP